MKVGLLQFFSWTGRVPVATVYDRAMDRVDRMEDSAFDCIWLAEHHFHEYGSVPNPAVFLAAASQRTTHIGLGVAVYRSWWTVGALVALVTVRHRIPDTGANSVEGYFHPRMLAFALGLSATALYLAGRSRLALGIVVVAILVHPTIGFWFAIMAVVNQPWPVNTGPCRRYWSAS